MAKSIYKDKKYKEKIYQLYDNFAADLPAPLEEGYLDTNFGRTHYLMLGSPDRPILVHFHGGNSLNPYALLPLVEFTDKFRILSPDIIGQPGKSAENRLNPKSLDHGRWAREFLNHFPGEKYNCLGVSYGGGVLMHLAAVSPASINKAAYLVPTGFVRANTFDNLRLFGLPLLRYYIKRSQKNLQSVLQPLIGDVSLLTDRELEMFKLIFDGLKLSTGMPRPVEKEELLDFNSPCLLAVAENDIMCPADRVTEFARSRLSSLDRIINFENRPHMVTSYHDSLSHFLTELDRFFQINS